MELRKSYKELIIWLISFLAVFLLCAFLPIKNGDLLLRILMNIIIIGVVALTYLIYKTENIYWYTGINYEDAAEAGSIRRKEYAKKHYVLFRNAGIILCLYTVISYMLHIYSWIDVIVVCIGVCVTAIRTMKIEL